MRSDDVLFSAVRHIQNRALEWIANQGERVEDRNWKNKPLWKQIYLMNSILRANHASCTFFSESTFTLTPKICILFKLFDSQKSDLEFRLFWTACTSNFKTLNFEEHGSGVASTVAIWYRSDIPFLGFLCPQANDLHMIYIYILLACLDLTSSLIITASDCF